MPLPREIADTYSGFLARGGTSLNVNDPYPELRRLPRPIFDVANVRRINIIALLRRAPPTTLSDDAIDMVCAAMHPSLARERKAALLQQYAKVQPGAPKTVARAQ